MADGQTPGIKILSFKKEDLDLDAIIVTNIHVEDSREMKGILMV